MITLIITWVFWPRESAVVSPGKTVRASEPAAVNDFEVCSPGWETRERGGLAFSGHLVVWSVEDKSGSRLMAADVRVHRPFLLLRAGKNVTMRNPVLNGTTLIWRQHRSSDPAGTSSLWVMDVGTRKARQISAPVAIDALDVSQGEIVWLQRTSVKGEQNDRIYLDEVGAGRREQIPAANGPKTDVAYDQGMVAWSANTGRPETSGVWLYEPMGRSLIRVTSHGVKSVDISGAYVVWVDSEGAVRAFNMDSGEHKVLSYGNGMATRCRVDGPLVVWWDASAIGDAALMKVGDVYAADLRTGRRFPISTHGSAQEGPQVSGFTVVWPDDRRGGWILRGAQVSL